MKITKKRIPLFTFLLIFSSSHLYCAPSKIVDSISDNTNHIDGLDNPRQIKLSPDNSFVYVVSSDDNSLAIFGANQDLGLTFTQVFQDTNAQDLPLEGASDLVSLSDGKKILVVSFYDGAISIFERKQDGQYVFSKAISDKLSYQRVFKDSEPLEGLDKHGLLGAWSLIKSSDEKQIFVAAYQSNAISVFDVSANMDIQFSHVIRSTNIDLGNPVSLALSPSNSTLFVVGYEKHKLTVFSRTASGELVVKQIIETTLDDANKCLNPQKILVSEKGRFLYLACSGSHSIAVYSLNNGEYALFQTISHSAIGGSGLTGVGSLALSHDGNRLYAGAEGDSGLLIFDIKASGELNLKRRLTFEEYGIRAVSSIALTNDGNYLLTTLAKDDKLMTIKLR